MAIEVNPIVRTFKMKDGTVLPDPNPEMTPEEVLEFYTPEYPQFVTATIEPPVINVEKSTALYNIKDTLGTKG